MARIAVGAQGIEAIGGLAVQTDGKILATVSADDRLTLVRLDPHGAVDSSFYGGGRATTLDPGFGLTAPVVVGNAIRVAGSDSSEDPRTPEFFVRTFGAAGDPGSRIVETVRQHTIAMAAAAGATGNLLVMGARQSCYCEPFADAIVTAFGADAVAPTFGDVGTLSTRPIADRIAQEIDGGLVWVDREQLAVGGQSVVLLVNFQARTRPPIRRSWASSCCATTQRDTSIPGSGQMGERLLRSAPLPSSRRSSPLTSRATARS
jgi:hypothetical protein